MIENNLQFFSLLSGIMIGQYSISLICLIFIQYVNLAEDKWIWDKDNSARHTVAKALIAEEPESRPLFQLPQPNKLRSDASARYEVYEGEVPEQPSFRPQSPGSFNRPQLGNSNRPLPPRPDLGPNLFDGGPTLPSEFTNRPINNPLGRPAFSNPSGRPTFNNPSGRPSFNNPLGRPTFNNPSGRPFLNPNKPGVLTGPIPSWEKPVIPPNNDPTSFDKCKCVHSFNCKSPSLQFGSCDSGKQYCCFNDRNPNPQGGIRGGGYGAKLTGNRPILVGPPDDLIEPRSNIRL